MSSEPSETVRDAASVSLVLTVLDEAPSVPAFLETLARQTVAPAELVVVDGGSTDGTAELFATWRPPGRTAVRVEVVPGLNIAQGRNRAIELARHDHVLVTDGGTTLHPRWVEALAAALRDGADVAAGFFEPAGGTPFAQALAAVITPLRDEIDPATFLPSSRSLGVTRAAWREAGGYPEWLDYCEDLVLDLELKRLGATFAFVPEAVVTWDARPSLAAFARQYYRYARGDGRADLWRRRHAARYAAYALGVAVLASRRPAAVPVLLVGGWLYLAKFVRRVLCHERGGATTAGLALVPVVVVTGDFAKMAGYPVGVARRVRARVQPSNHAGATA
ncbi:glycosyltransferase [Luteimicrobium subarcticum]|uniref:4,4'-diaponeurosporenoate glycosyltransferase n=1 Tax=Luteimicrobium subarcticum TaxID=620910 RepID=A0A2M8WUV1_9MICO|nr:glycosyltransferase [Luteimicrobium subarcticum]PJI94721.1 glycosyltransferase involved in cell wall biosynthesis [Luteimicrobium subarcticum]